MENEKLYELAKALFLKKIGNEFLSDKNMINFKSISEDSINSAKIFLEVFERLK